MEKYTNRYGTECYRNVRLNSLFSPKLFHRVPWRYLDRGKRFALFTNLGNLTVLNKLTGFLGYEGQVKDIESSFMDVSRNFWLASGMCDVRESGAKTFGEAIEWIKERANTYVPKNITEPIPGFLRPFEQAKWRG